MQPGGEVSNEVSRLFRGSRSSQNAIATPPSRGATSGSSRTPGLAITPTPRFRLAHNFGPFGRQASVGKKRKAKVITGPLMKDVILLGGPEEVGQQAAKHHGY